MQIATRSLVAGACLLLAGQAAAFPGLYDVTGVSADDALNVRAHPSTASAIVGRFEATQTGIEVVATDAAGAWGQVNLGEGAAWVSMRFLAPQDGVWTPGGLPETLACFGTEPFWSIRVEDGALAYSTPEDGRSLAPVAVLDSGIAGDARRMVTGGTAGDRMTVAMVPTTCSDGMSDRVFGLETLVLVEEPGAARLLTGCCSIAR